jgi:membrane-bound lytic murein transglycosylase B
MGAKMHYLLSILLVSLLLHAHDDRPPISYDFLKMTEVKRFISNMERKHQFSRNYLLKVLRDAKLDRDTLARYQGKYKAGSTNGTWERYKAHVLDPLSLKKARKFKKRYYQSLLRASRLYRVDMDYIVGFMGVESKFGEYTGDYRVLDSLTTLAFHKNRMQRFFKAELEHLFLLVREKGYNIYTLQGSFAGAMGCVQQVPSIARKHRSDFNNDGKTDPWDIEDCIGSIAKFMHKKGWKKGKQVVVATRYKGKRYTKLRTSHKKKYSLKMIKRYGITPKEKFHESKAYLLKTRNLTHDDMWLGASNFRVLTRYNNSTSYGVAIHLIAAHVK